ncbi:MAG: hypothetical protein GF381_04740 [Candidatus Pacebacteria bacterium]|nr:hypothetical protein [Candidatus Paceibacterota bacterium]
MLEKPNPSFHSAGPDALGHTIEVWDDIKDSSREECLGAFYLAEPIDQWAPLIQNEGWLREGANDSEIFSSKLLANIIRKTGEEATSLITQSYLESNPVKLNDQIEGLVKKIDRVLERIANNPFAQFVERVDALGRRMVADFIGKEGEIRYTTESLDEFISKEIDDVRLVVTELYNSLIDKLEELRDSSETREESRIADLINTLHYLDNVDLLEEFPSLIKNAHQIRELQERTIGYLRYLREELSQRVLSAKELEMAEVLVVISEKMGVEMIEPEQMRRFWFEKIEYIQLSLEDRGEFGAGDIKIKIPGEEEPLSLVVLHEMIEDLPKDSVFREFVAPIEEAFGYVRLAQTARHYFHLGKKHYNDPRALVEALKEESQEGTKYLTFRDFIKNLLGLRDEFEVPWAERARMPILMYDSLQQINLVREVLKNALRDRESKDYKDLIKKSKQAFSQRQSEVGEVYSADSFDDLTVEQQLELGATFLLTRQMNLDFLTLGQAKFILNNVRRLVPPEMISPDEREETRVAVRLLASAGVVRGNAGIDSLNPEWQSYYSLIGPELEVDVQGGEVLYKYKGSQVTESTTFEDSSGQTTLLLPVLEKMERYGRRLEQVVFEMMIPSGQFSTADTKFKSFQTAVRMYLLYHIARYDESKYAGYDRMDHVILEVIAQLGLPYYQVAKLEVGAPTPAQLSTWLADPDSDLSEFEFILSQTPGMSENLPEFYKRILDLWDLLTKPEKYPKINMRFEDMGSKSTEEIAEALKEAYKVCKYWVQAVGVEYALDLQRFIEYSDLFRYKKGDETKPYPPLAYRGYAKSAFKKYESAKNEWLQATRSGNESEAEAKKKEAEKYYARAEDYVVWSLFFSVQAIWLLNAGYRAYDQIIHGGPGFTRDQIRKQMVDTLSPSMAAWLDTLSRPNKISRTEKGFFPKYTMPIFNDMNGTVPYPDKGNILQMFGEFFSLVASIDKEKSTIQAPPPEPADLYLKR